MSRALRSPFPDLSNYEGIVPVRKGGTGADNSLDAAKNLGAISKLEIGQLGGPLPLGEDGKIPQDYLLATTQESGGGSYPNLRYPDSMMQGIASYIEITNFDPDMNYEIEVSGGQGYLVGDRFEIIPDIGVSEITIVINGRELVMVVTPVGPMKPTITAPLTGTGDVGRSVVVEVSPYEAPEGGGEFRGLIIQSAVDPQFNQILGVKEYNKPFGQIPAMKPDTRHYVRVAYVNTSGVQSPWSDVIWIQSPVELEGEGWGVWAAVKKLTGTGHFGYSVAMNHDGSMAIVGTSANMSSGNSVYIYQRSGSTYTLVQKLTGTGRFGRSVAMNPDGSMVIVGTYDGNYAEIYQRTDSEYVLVQKLTGTGYFGFSVAMNHDGSMVIVGTSSDSSSGNSAHIYQRSGSTYTLVQKLTGTGRFGRSAAMNHDGSMVIIGTYDGGFAEIYRRSGSNYTLVQKLTGTDNFGASVAMNSDGSMVIIGATVTGTSAIDNYAEIYERSGSTYTLVQKLTGEGGFGRSVAMSRDGTMLIVGAATNSTSSSGNYAEIYQRSDSEYVLVQKLTGTGDFGWSVAMNHDGSMVIVGTYADTSEGNYAEIAMII